MFLLPKTVPGVYWVLNTYFKNFILAALGLCCSTQGFSPVPVHRPSLIANGVQPQLTHSKLDLSSPTRDQTHILCVGRWIFNPWTIRDVPQFVVVV